jgi:small-conductance mechanosensitive channel
LLTLLTFAITIFVLIGIRKGTHRLADNVVLRLEEQLEATHRPVVAIVPKHHLRGVVTSFFKGLRLLLSVAVVALSFQLLLFFYPRTKYAASYLLNSVLDSVSEFASAIWAHAPAMAFLLLLAIATWYLLKFLRFVFNRVADGSVTIEGFRPAWAGTTQRLVSMMLIVLAVLIAFPYIPGSDSPAFQGISIFLGLLLSLGSTGLVSNMVTGVMLTYMDAFQVGDLIRVGDFVGRVQKTSLLTTRLQTRKNEIVTIPNSLMLAHEVTNLSSAGEKGLVINSTIGVGYDAPWRQVESMMKLAAARTPGVSRTVAPFVYTMSLNQFDITHELNVHLEKGAPYWDTKSELNRNVLDAFNEYGVQIMTPAYEGDPEGPKVVPKSHWFAEPAIKREPSENNSAGERVRRAG